MPDGRNKKKQIWCQMDDMKKKIDARRTKWKKNLLPDGRNEEKKNLMPDGQNEK